MTPKHKETFSSEGVAVNTKRLKIFGVVKSAKMRKIIRMADTYHARLKQMSKRLDDMITVMDIYAKYEITSHNEISENLLYADSMKPLDIAMQRLNDKHKNNRKA